MFYLGCLQRMCVAKVRSCDYCCESFYVLEQASFIHFLA